MDKIKELLLKVKPSGVVAKLLLGGLGLVGVTLSPEASELVGQWMVSSGEYLVGLHVD